MHFQGSLSDSRLTLCALSVGDAETKMLSRSVFLNTQSPKCMAGLFHPDSVEGGREKSLLQRECKFNNTLGAFPNVMIKSSQKQGIL